MDFVDQVQQIIEHMKNGVDAADIKALSGCLKSLETGHAGKQHAMSVIKMMQSLTKYLGSRKDKAHPGTLPAIGTLAGNLKSLLGSPALENQVQILSKSKHTFESLRSAIESGKPILDSEMEELKAVILSVDWEISSITMKGFDRVLTRLEKQLKSHKMHYTFLRIMHQTGAHIAKRKADAHQDSISLLRWVFQQYELLVAHPDMAPDKKKQLVQESIQAYKAFKRKIDAGSSPDQSPGNHAVLAARTDQHPAPGAPAAPDNSGDNDFPSALSHVNKEASDPEDDLFFALDDPMTDPAQVPGSTKGTLSTKKDSSLPQQDVMEDLFSIKESPADELLDAIHLSNMHGPDQENAAAMPGVVGAAGKKAGIQQVTSQRMDNTPIPEIERRLDAFFSLNSPEDDTHLDVVPGNNGDALPGISRKDHGGGNDMLDREPAPELDDLRGLLSAPGTLSSLDVLEQVQEKVASLNEIWAPDSDKAGLLDLVSSMARFIHQQALSDTEEDGLCKDPGSDDELDGMDTAKPNEAQETHGNQKKTGVFARLKARFKG